MALSADWMRPSRLEATVKNSRAQVNQIARIAERIVSKAEVEFLQTGCQTRPC